MDSGFLLAVYVVSDPVCSYLCGKPTRMSGLDWLCRPKNVKKNQIDKK